MKHVRQKKNISLYFDNRMFPAEREQLHTLGWQIVWQNLVCINISLTAFPDHFQFSATAGLH